MKKLFLLTFALMTSALVINCARDEQKRASGSSDMSTACLYSQVGLNNGSAGGCNFNYAATPGFTNYDSSRAYNYTSMGYGYQNQYNYNGQQSLTSSQVSAGCSTGYQVVYSGRKGLGCVDTRYLPGGNPGFFVLNPYNNQLILSSQMNNAYNGQTGTGVNGQAYNPFYNQNNVNYMTQNLVNSGWATVMEACDQQDPCSPGLTCQAMATGAYGSSLGVCFY